MKKFIYHSGSAWKQIFHIYEIDFLSSAFIYSIEQKRQIVLEQKFSLTKEEIDLFISLVEASNFSSWQDHYVNIRIRDGHQWYLIIDNKKVTGSNKKPEKFIYIQQIISNLSKYI